jgi:hypothetical protein
MRKITRRFVTRRGDRQGVFSSVRVRLNAVDEDRDQALSRGEAALSR